MCDENNEYSGASKIYYDIFIAWQEKKKLSLEISMLHANWVTYQDLTVASGSQVWSTFSQPLHIVWSALWVATVPVIALWLSLKKVLKSW